MFNNEKFKLRTMHAQNGDGSPNNSAGQANVQSQVSENPVGPECRRTLATASYSANAAVAIDIPRDTVIKRIEHNFTLGCTATYASGAFTVSPLACITKVIPNYYLVADGSRNIKVLDLYMSRCMSALAFGSFPRRAYQTGASLLASTLQPTTEHLAGTVAGGATTQDFIYNEIVPVHFENPFAYSVGKSISLLYTKNLSTCTQTFGFATIDNILNAANAALAFSAITCNVVSTIVENRDADISAGAFDFTETVIRKQYSSQTTLSNIDLNTGNKLTGLGLMVQDGGATRLPSDVACTDLNLVVNGATSIQSTNFKRLMNANKSRYSLGDDQFASGVHALNGFAYMNLIKDGNLLSGLDTRLVAGVSQVQLQVSTASSTGVDPATYTNPVQISVLQQQMIPVPVKS